MSSDSGVVTVPVDDGAVPVHLTGPAPEPGDPRPGLLCVPSIFGANHDLMDQMASLADVAVPVVMDPFWSVEAGPIPYDQRQDAFDRAGKLDRSRTGGEVAAVAGWLSARTNGSVVGLGICFGGPPVLVGAASGLLAGVVAWHGSRMEQVLDRIEGLTAPVRLHFGDADHITPPEVIEAITAALADHPDCRIVVHPGAVHGFSHEGDAWDPVAAAAGMADLRDLLASLG